METFCLSTSRNQKISLYLKALQHYKSRHLDISFVSLKRARLYIKITLKNCRLVSYSLDINIRFRSVSSRGLLVWSGGARAPPDFLSLAIEDSVLVFR